MDFNLIISRKYRRMTRFTVGMQLALIQKYHTYVS
jgi:hypothetical protein